MYQDLRLYVDFNWEEYVDNSINYLEIFKIVKLAYQHKADVFYSGQQVQEFVKNCHELDENFSQSHGNKLGVLLANAIKKTNKSYFFKVCFADKNTSLNYVNDTAISIIDPHSNNALISISKDEYEPLLSIKSATDFQVISFKVINTTEELLDWIQTNSTARNFNLSPKHGESGRGNWPKESPLLCTEYEAQQLLNTAIPDFPEKEKQLFNYDDTHQTYIEFFYEGANPKNKWHGFHITQNEWDKRIPSSIRKYFGK